MAATEQWVVAEGEADGMPVIVRLDEGAGGDEERGRFPWNLVVSVPFRNPNDVGFYDPAEGERLERIEESLDSALDEQGGRMVAAVTLDGHRDLIAYVATEDAADAVAEALEEAAPDYELEVLSQDDAAWAVYDDLAAPLREAEDDDGG